jgi:hypothetical protein
MEAIRDQNFVTTWLGISSVDGFTLVPIKVNESDGTMAMEIGVSVMPVMASLPAALPRDNNRVTVLGGVSSADTTVVLPLSVNPVTGAVQAQTT